MRDTEDLGRRIALASAPGTVIAFRGGLGAGKTAMTRGIASGLGVADPVTSPTYTLINEYEGAMPLYHFDAYRLGSAEEFDRLDASRYLYDEGLSVIEWSERVADALPADAVIVDIEPQADGSRLVSISGSPVEEALA